MEEILKEALRQAGQIGRLQNPPYSQGYTQKEAEEAAEKLLQDTMTKLKKFIGFNVPVIFRIGAPCWANFGGNNLKQATVTQIDEDGKFTVEALGTGEVMSGIHRELFRPRANM